MLSSAPDSRLVLASASPRRVELLASVGLHVDAEPVDVDESWTRGEVPIDYVTRVARLKLETHLARSLRVGVTVIAADTTVDVDGEPLGKPESDAHALAMLERLSGRGHRVSTAVSIGQVGHGVLRERCVTTEVKFRDLSRATLMAYVATGEGRDKAGSYAIQGIGAGLVRAISGSYSNVVGLPVAETLELLLEVGAIRSWP